MIVDNEYWEHSIAVKMQREPAKATPRYAKSCVCTEPCSQHCKWSRGLINHPYGASFRILAKLKYTLISANCYRTTRESSAQYLYCHHVKLRRPECECAYMPLASVQLVHRLGESARIRPRSVGPPPAHGRCMRK